jgi:limonene-1,2-epoxide hydrolase
MTLIGRLNMPNRRRVSLAALLAASMALLAAWPAVAQHDGRTVDAWLKRTWTFQSEHYDVQTDLERADAEALARHMDRMFEHYGRVFSGLRVRKDLKLNLLLFAKMPDYLATMKLRYDSKAEGTAGICVQERSRVTLAAWKEYRSVEHLKRTLQHEGFHQFARALFPGIPSWADEGLAEIFETAIVLGDRVIFGEVDSGRLEILRRAARANSLIPVESLMKINQDNWMDHVNAGEGSLQYAQAWALVHLLLYADHARYQPAFEQFLSIMNAGQSWQTAFYRAFNTRDFDQLQQRLGRYFDELRPTDLRETIRRMDALATGLSALHEKGTHPATMDELKAALRELGFVHASQLFEPIKTFRATDEHLYQVPAPGQEKIEIVFELIEPPPAPNQKPGARRPAPRPARPDAPKESPSEAKPAPAKPRVLTTRGLEPMELTIEWSLDEKTGRLSHQIIQR